MKISETLPSRLELIPDFISSLIEKLYYLPLDEYMIFNIKLALQEAVINAVEHGNKMRSDLLVKVDIIADDQRLTIEVTDQGSGFDYTVVPNPTEPQNIEKLRGRGIFLIRHVMNKIEFTGKGRTIRMIKYIEKERRVKMQAQIEKVGSVAVLALAGEINVTNAGRLREASINVTKEGLNKILVDFEKIGFIDSSGLAVLIEMVKCLKEKEGKLVLCSVNKKIRGIFEITKVHNLIDIYDNREAALKAFK